MEWKFEASRHDERRYRDRVGPAAPGGADAALAMPYVTRYPVHCTVVQCVFSREYNEQSVKGNTEIP